MESPSRPRWTGLRRLFEASPVLSSCCFAYRGPEQLNSETPVPSSASVKLTRDMNNLAEISFSSLLELAADNNVEGFKQLIFCIASAINDMGLWYGRQRASNQMVLEHRTPLMVAAMYGSVDVVKLILSLSEVDVNLSCGPDKSTALHCAASSGSVNAVDVVKLLLIAGADRSSMDANGRRPIDVVVAPPKFPDLKDALEVILRDDDSIHLEDLKISCGGEKSVSPPLSSSPKNGPLFSAVESSASLNHFRFGDIPASCAPEKKEYLVDPSFPDIKNSVYSTDEFRMFSFKIRPCSRAYSHDWTECPFVHPGENARRRDLRKFHYSCVPCPDFRKGQCRRGDLCEYAHGVFECWLHPAQYRTRLCKDGTSCSRRVCFFAHTPEELRPLYMSTGSAVPSPRSSTSAASVMDMAVALSLLPGSPSAVGGMSPSPFTPPMSPSGNAIMHPSVAWPQQNIPALHLPGSNLQTSRLRSSFNARDIPTEELNMLLDFEVQQQQFLNDISGFSQTHPNTSSTNLPVRSKTLTPSNLDDIFSTEVSSPRFSDQNVASPMFSPSHKPVVLNQFQQPQNILSPINTNLYSPNNVDHPFMQAPYHVPSPGRMSPRGIELQSPFSPRLSSLAHCENQQTQLRSLSSRDLGTNLPRNLGSNGAGIVGSPVNSLAKWEYPNGAVDWSVNEDELARVRKSFTSGHNGEEPDLSWVQSLVKESPPEIKENSSE
ncbi:CCCH-type zinc finger protein with ARM repeat domain-containing protein [Actinidia rufa]|uniref:CCCH-type zinc finger protein with ARM repeat domain-containing protein n=1 Tax=Actinidia rufa TaxID=165716 RepID=A0A7J0FJM5_9ERIC|nr:CCCH-type zinc finger protein with ARM repeat domain-containing protein [Actinidia rufa]